MSIKQKFGHRMRRLITRMEERVLETAEEDLRDAGLPANHIHTAIMEFMSERQSFEEPLSDEGKLTLCSNILWSELEKERT